MKRGGYIQRKTRLKPGGPIARTKGMSKKTSKPKYATKERVALREQWRADNPLCWLCLYYDRHQVYASEIHEIVNRSGSGQPYEPFNYASLCGHSDYDCHHRLQSRGHAGRVVCWALKLTYDMPHFDLKASLKMLGRGDYESIKLEIALLSEVMRILGEKQKL